MKLKSNKNTNNGIHSTSDVITGMNREHII